MSPFSNDDLEPDYTSYLDDAETPNIYSSNNLLLKTDATNTNSRDPRSKSDINTKTQTLQESAENTTEKMLETNKTLKKNLSEEPRYGIYDYKNIQKAHTRLLHDLNSLPNEILRDTYFKNRERQLRKSRFEQRDLKSHHDRIKENDDLEKAIEEEKKASFNLSESLWDLESEKELQDKENGYWRVKREEKLNLGVPRLTSIGMFLYVLFYLYIKSNDRFTFRYSRFIY